ncbi:MAG: hypothetical protein GY796_27930 [Chloroflexi bacterium]|nr:hypothetical protein [Chloroflexota bacterium]
MPHVLSIYTSIVLFIVMVGFAKLAYDVFIADIQLSDPNNMFLMTLRVFVAGIAFLPALGLSHFGIHKLNDGLLPYTTRVFGWFCMALTGFLHLKIVYNITISLVPATRSIVYVLTIAAGLMAIIGLHSVQKEQNWRVFAYPFMFLLAFQLLAIFAHYFVYMLDVGRLWLDVLFLVGTVLIALGFFTASRKSK